MKLLKKIPGMVGALQRHNRIVLPRLTFARLVNLCVLGIEMLFRRPKLISKPVVAKIEACSACNLSCEGCRSGHLIVEYPAGNMSTEDFGIVLDKMGKYLFEIVFYNWGEPLMNKKVPELVKMAHQHNISVIISTNLHYLTEEMGDRLLEAQLDKLIFCIDGWSQESYQQVRIGGDFDLVINNIKRFIDQRNKAGMKKPYLEWQYVVTQRNRPELAMARSAAGDWGVDRFVELVDWSQRLDDKSYFNGLDKAWEKMRGKRNRCFWLWSSIAMQYDGNVFPCCHVANKPYEDRIFGNLVSSSLDEVWNGPKYRMARQYLRSKRRIEEGDFICKECNTPPIFIEETK